MKRPRNHYDNLKVDRKASPEEIKKAYRRLSSQHHPDKNGGSAESVRVMKVINAAYEALSDPERRANHDAWIARVEPPVRQGPTAAQKSQVNKLWEKKTPTEPKTHKKEKASTHVKSKKHSTDEILKEFTRRSYRYGGTKYKWTPPKPKLRPEHRPKGFDESHLEEFRKYNDAMREKLYSHHLDLATPEQIYRAFILDKRKRKEAPETMADAYQSLNRALKNREDTAFSKLMEVVLNRSRFSPIILTCFVGTLLVIGCILALS